MTEKTERNAELIRRALAGESYASIARSIGVTVSRVQRICVRSVGRRKAQRIDEAAVVKLCEAGLSETKIARRLKVSRSGITAVKRRLGLTSPHRGAFQRKPIPEEFEIARSSLLRDFARGFTYDEIASRTGMTRGAVAGKVWRARRAIARQQ